MAKNSNDSREFCCFEPQTRQDGPVGSCAFLGHQESSGSTPPALPPWHPHSSTEVKAHPVLSDFPRAARTTLLQFRNPKIRVKELKSCSRCVPSEQLCPVLAQLSAQTLRRCPNAQSSSQAPIPSEPAFSLALGAEFLQPSHLQPGWERGHTSTGWALLPAPALQSRAGWL